jgi:hypothetical protein
MMQCEKCGGSYVESFAPFTIDDSIVGKVSVHRMKYFRCDQCDNILLSIEMSKAIGNAINERKQELINSMPIRNFITAKETSELLGITRQALHKNHRVNNGFIHQTKLGANVVYVKQSVIQYRNTGDGRYPLSEHKEKYYQFFEINKFVSRNRDFQTQYNKSNLLSFLKTNEMISENKEIVLYGNKR